MTLKNKILKNLEEQLSPAARKIHLQSTIGDLVDADRNLSSIADDKGALPENFPFDMLVQARDLVRKILQKVR